MSRGVHSSKPRRHGARASTTFSLLLIALLLFLASMAGNLPHSTHAFGTGEAAATVLGQQNYSGISQYRATAPEGIAFDSSGNLWVADAQNNRVLRFPAPLANGEGADLVIGQANFTSGAAATSQSGLHNPTSVSFDSSGNLWVVDAFNNRVLRFSAPFTTGMNANLVLGQSGFITSTGLSAATQSSLYSPWQVAFGSGGSLWVADCGNNRVLRFAPPFSSGMNASLVVGQAGYTTYASATSQTGMSCPISLAFDTSGYLWVSDLNNNRVLQFGPQFSSGAGANLVLGQNSFTAGAAATSQSGLSGPWFLSFDSGGDLWVSDTGNYRVLEFSPPFANGANANLVLGQAGFTSISGFAQSWFNSPEGVAFDSSGNLWVSDSGNGAIVRFPSPFTSGEASNLVIGQGQNSLTLPRGLFVDPSGNLWVGDSGNNRVVRYSPTYSNGMNANLVIGQGDFTRNGETTAQNRLTSAGGVMTDSSGSLWVSDFYSNRILRFSPPFSSGMSADLVIGQSSFTANGAATTSSGLSTPRYFTLDSTGDLWVADQANNRVLMFAPPFSSGMGATLVIGQSGFTTSLRSLSQGGLNNPAGIVFDSSGDLWVADQGNNRTLMFSPPFSSGMNARLVLGQPGFAVASAATTQAGMSHPEGVSADPRGNVWVVDQSNNRVLRFSPPFTSGMVANLVLGQTSFGTSSPAAGGSGLYLPRFAAFDSAGNVWVSEANNNRVMKFVCAAECPPSSLSFGYSVHGGGTGYSAPVLTYMYQGVPHNTTLTGQATNVSVDYGSKWSVPATLSGSGSTERWATAQAASGTATTTQTLSLSYSHQFSVTLGYTLTGGGSGYTPPSANYTQFGQTKSASPGSSVWADSGTPYSFQASLAGSSSVERWSAKSSTGTVAGAGAITVPYFHQYDVNATFSVVGGGSPTPPTLASTQFGSSFSIPLADKGSSFWFDGGATWTLTNPLGGSTDSERWQSNLTSGVVNKPLNLATPGSSSVVYQHQFLLTVSSSPAAGGTVSPAGGWFLAGSSVSLAASPSQGYGFTGWTGSGSGSYSGSSNPASVAVNAAFSETAGFALAAPTSTTTASSSTSAASTSSSATASQSATGGGGGIPEFPPQAVAAIALTILLVASYLFRLRRRTTLAT